MGEIVLNIENAGKSRAALQVLDGVSLNAATGQRIALLGHNGAGKSTLMKAVLGLTPLSAGRISVAGSAPGSAAARAATAYLPEAVAFHKSLTGREQLTLFARLADCPVAQVAGYLDRVGLSEAADRRIGTYSKGMRQRLGLAQVLLGRPKLALLDEPTSGLDPISRHELYAIIDEMAELGTAVLIASHTLTEVEARTDRIAILRAGRLVADDTLENLTLRAGLPTRLRIRANGDAAGRIVDATGGTRVNGMSVDLLCAPERKMTELRRLSAMGDVVADIEMHPPRLEDLYRHYSTGENH
ncbi:ABC transporter ATP-binding protein [Sedimentitalea nanhaiensis]|uniref:Cu-processing system ATP-binding protein n=1 Tax=Sedimentitalea nanhaiensis TaxID=999627 RepID=A0A1I7E8P6_9RHOB|nr:ABC transporter ATP-binding protein [Sedimentitalea nanhaiensis]SFU20193.1 Cu-processing system ATP-binding protein [Sedimentitalea nanhaiensis]